jgi:hypothetical protein
MLRKGEMQALIEPHNRELIHQMATHEPNNWRMRPNVPVDNYAEMWADEILPIAREAYARLQFTDVHPQQQEDRTVAAGEAAEEPAADKGLYRVWATNIVRDELHKAGWRLADLLEKIL